MTAVEGLKTEIEKLKERNGKVEANKAWELSWTRKLILVSLTYIVAGLTLQSLNIAFPWKSAFVPTIGFLLSTLTLPFIRNIWQKYIYKK